MNRNKLISYIKYNNLAYTIYYRLGSFTIKLLKFFLRADDKLILFVSYGGRKYDDTPKDIYEFIQKDQRFHDYKLVWAFVQPELFDIGNGSKIKIDSFEYYKTALKARIWITNVAITRALDFKGINTLSLNSWHGTAIKYIGNDMIKGVSFITKEKNQLADYMLAQSHYDINIYSRAFSVPKSNIILTGFPRNDSLVKNAKPDHISKLKEKFGIPQGKKVILYAPTFRDYERENNCWALSVPFNLDRLEREFSNQYVIVVKAHIAIVEGLKIKETEFVKNLSAYPNLNDILLVSDILISDYSGILFDFAVLGRPIFCYTYDYEKYKTLRGMYIDVRQELSYAENEDELIQLIKNYDAKEEIKKVCNFRSKYVEKYGDASKEVTDFLYEKVSR